MLLIILFLDRQYNKKKTEFSLREKKHVCFSVEVILPNTKLLSLKKDKV